MVRALVVDDSRIMRMVIRGHLKKCGIAEHDIAEAGDGQEALDTLARDKIDLVLSDVNMPIMDGEQLLTWLAESDFLERGRAVMVTSRYERHLFRRLLHTGAATIIRKPFSLEGFQRQLEPVLQDLADVRGEAAPTLVRDVPVPSVVQAPAAELELSVSDSASDTLLACTRHVLKTSDLDTTPFDVTQVTATALFMGEIELEGGDGHLAFYADHAAANAVGQNLTQLPPVDDDLRADAVGELANIVAGVWQSKLGRETAFSTPKTAQLDASDVVWEGLAGLQVGEGHVWVGLIAA